MEAGEGDRGISARRGDDDAVRSGAGHDMAVATKPKVHDGCGAGLGGDRKRFDARRFGQGCSDMGEKVDRADGRAPVKGFADPAGIGKADGGEAGGGDGAGRGACQIMLGEAARGHEVHRLAMAGFVHAPVKEFGGIDVHRQVSVPHLEPDDGPRNDEAGSGQRPAQHVLRLGKFRDEEGRCPAGGERGHSASDRARRRRPWRYRRLCRRPRASGTPDRCSCRRRTFRRGDAAGEASGAMPPGRSDRTAP